MQASRVTFAPSAPTATVARASGTALCAPSRLSTSRAWLRLLCSASLFHCVAAALNRALFSLEYQLGAVIGICVAIGLMTWNTIRDALNTSDSTPVIMKIVLSCLQVETVCGFGR